jgi:hypothetical protein
MVRGSAAVFASILASCGLGAGNTYALTPGRAYEMVSPLYKGGYAAGPLNAVSPDGESVVFSSQGAFAGTTSNLFSSLYLARRGETGWSTSPLAAPASILPVLATLKPFEDITTDFGSLLYSGYAGEYAGLASHEGKEELMVTHKTSTADVPENFKTVNRLKAVENSLINVRYDGASQDFGHILFNAARPEALLTQALVPGNQLYELSAGSEQPELVGVSDAGELLDGNCEVTLGSPFGRLSQFNAIADNGDVVFFTADANRAAGEECDGGLHTVPSNPARLYARISRQRTLLLSGLTAQECGPKAPCSEAAPARAAFEGANEAGSCVFFTTSQPLVTGDGDTSGDLYMARIGGPSEPRGLGCQARSAEEPVEVTSLIQVSLDPHSGQDAEVLGAIAISPDGSHVYFVARGNLTEGANPEGREPVVGADNLYVYERDERYPGGHIAFIGDLCSDAELSGEARDSSCPVDLTPLESDLELFANDPVQTAASGRYLFFDTYGQLRPGDDDTTRDIYRYDALTGELTRISHGEDGYATNGNSEQRVNARGESFDATLRPESLGAMAYRKARLGDRAVSEDGQRAVFTTADPLSPAASNGLSNVYEWRAGAAGSEGEVSLVSGGNADESSEEAMMSASGRDIFFITSQGLLPQDTDGAPDAYDARLGGGFPVSNVASQRCADDACQGPLSSPAPVLVPGSETQEAGGNFAEPSASKATPPLRTKRHRRKHRSLGRSDGRGKVRRAARSPRRAGR